MKCIVYRSTADKNLRDEDVQALLAAAQARNAKHKITGLLLFNGRQFIQAIEGDDMDIDYLLPLILVDPRHHTIEVMSEEYISAREFPDWSMQLVPFNVRSDIATDLEMRLPSGVKKALDMI